MMRRKSILFNAVCGPAYGLGHLMRSAVLAQALAAKGWHVAFLACSTNQADARQAQQLLRTAPFKVSPAPDPTSPDWPPFLSKWLEHDSYDWISADGYGICSAELMKTSRRAGARLLTFDDIGGKALKSDIILNPNQLNAALYDGPDAQAGLFLCGLKYQLIDRAYLNARQSRANTENGPLVLSFGGADIAQIAPRIFTLIDRYWPDRPPIRVIQGPYADYADTAFLSSTREVEIVQGLSSLAEEFQRAGAVFTTPSSAAWQAACVGAPIFSVTVADNQSGAAAILQQTGSAIVMDKAMLADDARAIEMLLSFTSASRRKELANRALDLIDGQGAERISSLLSAMTTI